MKRLSCSALLCGLLCCGYATADDAATAADKGDAEALRLESSVVTGNRELPKVMSIVPWKKSQPGELAGRPSNSLLNELLAPVDREVFRRQLRYYTRLADKARAEQDAADKE